jgi:hypothetical protein
MIASMVAVVLCAGPAALLNAQGEEALKAGRSREALALFRKAAEADPRLAPAFYNEALAMASLRRQYTLHWQPTKKDVLDAAEVALQLDPKMRERAEKELPAVRTTFRGQRLLGRSIERDAPAILEAIAWHSRAGERLAFAKDGTVSYSRGEPMQPVGKWSADGARITLKVSSHTYSGTLDTEGVLTIDGLGRFFDW